MKFENSLAFAKQRDKADPLKSFRNLFHFPKRGKKQALYLNGNSLGLQPKSAEKFVQEELKNWADLGVEGHFFSRWPWLYYHHFSKKALSQIVGAKPLEVVAMNQLTVNLHLLLISFYRPTPTSFKIITEAGAFSSDQYALESQARFHGYDPDNAIVELAPRPGEYTLRTEDILESIQRNASQLALVIFGAVQYYSGQFFNIPAITKAAHQAGAAAGFDLAHAIGNVPLQLHKDDVDFAAWCSYKYLNSGPGGVGGVFIHEKHANNFMIPRLAGWWGHHEKERFKMLKGFQAMPGADGWQVSNFPVISGAVQLASLEIFQQAGMRALRKKSVLLTGFLEYLISGLSPDFFEIITPLDPAQHGCQLSLLIKKNGEKIVKALASNGIMVDWRNSEQGGVLRVAPVPLYNTFEDVFRFATVFKSLLLKGSKNPPHRI
jgi:kynureninase